MMQSPHVASKRIASKASLSGVAYVAAALAAAQSTPNQSQPDALELLRNVEATYAAVGTYSTKSTHVIEMNGPSMQNKMETTETTTADSSGRFRRESTGLMGMVMVFDGSTMWTYMPQMNKYSRISLDQLKAKLQSLGHAEQSAGDAGTFAPAAGPFAAYRSVASNVKEAKVLRSEKLHVNDADADCWVVSVEYELQSEQASSEQTAAFPVKELSRSKTLWIDKARYLVYQEESASTMTMPGTDRPTNTKETTKLESISLDGPVSLGLFTFTPPAGATEMDLSKGLEMFKEMKPSCSPPKDNHQ